MKIKRIEIIGFKSFVDKVTLDFPHGITAIVGPNGCGKSNVVDAIRWVMGEQSAKNLRGRSMEDVIFGGSESRKPLGMAEVSLVFSTEDGRVPAKYLNYTEIQVTRRLYRDGDGEYFLNKTPCRLLDIHELFMDTGVGAKAYSVIEQGRIGMILLSKPEERRFLIEEAAGVTKFKARKQVALKKIEVTRQNLLRIGDIVAEIKRQMNSLHRQAKKAERFRACREELKEIEILFSVRTYTALLDARERASQELTELSSRISTMASDLEKGELALEERKIALLEEEKALTTAQEEIYRAKSACQGCENRIEFQRKELLNLGRHRDRFAEDLVSLERQLNEAGNELVTLDARKGAFVSEAEGEEQVLLDKERQLEDLTQAERASAAALEEKRRELFSLLSHISQYNNQRAGIMKRLEGVAERLERNRREEASLRGKLAETTARGEELGEKIRVEAEERTSLENRIAALKEQEIALKVRLEKQERELASARDELSRKSSRLHSLQELETQLAGYGQGVRALLLSEQYKGRFSGVVADIIETGAEFEAALEAVMGERLQYVIGATEEDALEAIGFLKDTTGGRCTFLLSGRPLSSAPAPEGAPRLLDAIAIDQRYREMIESLLADVHLVADLPTAAAFCRQFPHLSFVTRDGDMAFAGGVINGGSTEAVRQGLIHKKREIKELSREVELLSESVQKLDKGKDELKTALAALEDELRECRQQLHQAEIRVLNNEKDLQRNREECQRIDERLAVQGMEESQLGEERSLLEKDLSDIEAGKTVAEQKKEGIERAFEEMQQSLTVRRGEIDQLREAVTALKVSAAALREKREANLRAIKRVENLVQDLRLRLTGIRSELAKTEDEQKLLGSALAGTEEELRLLVQQQQAAELSFGKTKEKYEEHSTLVREEDHRFKGVRGAVEELRRSAGERNLATAELGMKMRHVENSLRDKYRLELDLLLSEHSGREFEEAEKLQRQSELQKLVDEMGEVNLTAIEEYQELETRHNFLVEQKNDLEESLNGLQKAIQRINRTTRKRFLETFQLVNSKFQEVFPRLFCGGRAELRLTNEDDLLETGIDIIVQPPGKKLQNVALLSGGEKALTAVALIFSIFLIKPSPFCLLDEVDAPLDDANIGRFNEMVKEMTAFSQFIMITHSKTTMMVADTLYGITMEEPGVSKLVSVRLNI